MSPRKAANDPSSASRAALMKKARAAILKSTKQKPLEKTDKQLPHVPSGSFPIDMLIGGSPNKNGEMICPGYPRRHITEIYGPESSGKTTLAIEAMVQAQKAGGMAMFLDFEHALDHRYASNLGLDYSDDKLMVYQPDSMEEGFKMIYIAIAIGVDIIVVDSVAAMVPKAELEKGFDDAAKIGAVARTFSQFLPKFVAYLHKFPKLEGDKEKTDPDHPGTALVFLNQTRANINTSGAGRGDNETTSGGKALKFYAYLRMRTSRIKSEFIERKDPISGKKRHFPYGNTTNVKIVKSKIEAKQGHSTEMFIRFGQGIDDYFSVIESSVTQKLVKRKGAYYVLGEHQFQGKDKFREFLIANDTVFEALKQKLREVLIASGGAIEPEESDDILEDMNFDDLDEEESSSPSEETVDLDEDGEE